MPRQNPHAARRIRERERKQSQLQSSIAREAAAAAIAPPLLDRLRHDPTVRTMLTAARHAYELRLSLRRHASIVDQSLARLRERWEQLGGPMYERRMHALDRIAHEGKAHERKELLKVLRRVWPMPARRTVTHAIHWDVHREVRSLKLRSRGSNPYEIKRADRMSVSSGGDLRNHVKLMATPSNAQLVRWYTRMTARLISGALGEALGELERRYYAALRTSYPQQIHDPLIEPELHPGAGLKKEDPEERKPVSAYSTVYDGQLDRWIVYRTADGKKMSTCLTFSEVLREYGRGVDRILPWM